MGTYYAVTLGRRPPDVDPERLHQAAAEQLGRVEALMSIYRADSEVTRINAACADEWVRVSLETAFVILAALQVGRRSGGTYDITVGPLVDLWGFGPSRSAGRVPAASEIATAREHVGVQLVEVRLDSPGVRKLDSQVRIDLSGVAKGYGVDLAAETLDRLGVDDYCIEVGGEVRTRGRAPHGRPWSVAIEAPEREPQAVHRMLSLSDRAMATSGDYRIFFEHAGKRYSHIIDPRTGAPIDNGIVSVTVVADACMLADAWAKAIMISGPEAGMELAIREKLAVLILVQTAIGLQERRSPRFERLV